MVGLVRDKQKEDFKMDPELRLEYKVFILISTIVYLLQL